MTKTELLSNCVRMTKPKSTPESISEDEPTTVIEQVLDKLSHTISSLITQDYNLCKEIHYRQRSVCIDFHDGLIRISPGPFRPITLQVEIVDPECVSMMEYEVFRILDIPFPGWRLS